MDRKEGGLYMRLFTAIELNEEAKQELMRLQQELKETLPCRKWQTKPQMHLTLHFLGDLSSQQMELVKQEMEDVTASFSPFSLTLANIGAFPNIKRPRVIWVGVSGHLKDLDSLQHTLAKRLTQKKLYSEDRTYAPHITLGREPRMEGNADSPHLPGVYPVSWRVGEIVLFHSTLTSKGPIYKIVSTYSLRA
ncbi:2'-5' RNA ligase [Aneurinibacillus aneurinilyticus ATCC 12856]|uniref:RNA 2',3'-cyclic phosphodiesterase n=2 Tax=Aneurinibacillus aneurinilyticus TaxID=1391 RepID=U1Y5S9_ANEAE|nr:2'-5' RNA ligase [Aneurinibacillus aneurinilyticus ATCC 12856]